jgi:hypothetical protein
MAESYTVRLVARNEGIEYRDKADVYRFNVRLADKKWTVYLPGSKGKQYVTHELTDDERNTILPRIVRYLEGRRYFGFIGRTYPAIFEKEGEVSPEIARSRTRAAKLLEGR